MKRKAFFLCLLLVSTLLVIGCEKEESSSQTIQKEEQQPNSEKTAPAYDEDNLPIKMEEGEFEKIYGWLNNETIVYSIRHQQESMLYVYHLKKGTSTLLFNVEALIDAIHISPSGNYLLIRSSSEASPSKITIMTNKGKIVYSQVLEHTFDAAVEWNPFDEDKILISSFTDEWQDQTYILSLEKQQMTEITVVNPFSYWMAENTLVYQDWNPSQTEYTEVMMKNLTNGKEVDMLSDVMQLDSLDHSILAITANKEEQTMTYSFYNEQEKLSSSIIIPRVNYSEQFIPYYDENGSEDRFFSFQPMKNASPSFINENFQLVQYNPLKSTQNVMMEELNNEPISCNEEGSLCLYGYIFEKLIDVKNKHIIQLVSTENEEGM